MCPNTQHQHKAAEQRRGAGQERGGKRDRISLIAVIHSLHNFSMFSSGGAVEKTGSTGKRRRFRIYDMRKPKYKQNKQTVFVGYSSGLYINATL